MVSPLASILVEEYQYRLFHLPVNIRVRGMTSSGFGDDRNGRELHVSVGHVWVLIKELLDFTLEILLGGESSGVLSYPDSPEIFIRPHRKNFDPQVAYLSICDGAERPTLSGARLFARPLQKVVRP